MSNLESAPEVDPTKSILLPESGSNAIEAFQVMNKELHLPVWFNPMPINSALDLLEKREVAAVLAGAKLTTGEVIVEGINKFNPRRNDKGELDPMGVRKLVSSFFAFERHGDEPFIVADCAVVEDPTDFELLEIAESTVSNARKLGINPNVAFLSYSTLGSGHGRSAAKMRAVARAFKQKHPDIPSIGEIQFDAATDEEIFKSKTGLPSFPDNRPLNVFIAANLDAGNNIYKIFQSRKYGGGWTAVGPLLQGFEEDRQLHDLSRGVTPEALSIICRYIARLSGLKAPDA
jgi:phosphotransacetylase